METAVYSTHQLKHLTCSACGKNYSADSIQTYATCCSQPLLAAYALKGHNRDSLLIQPYSMWRYAALLPLHNEYNRVSLGEGWTAIHDLHHSAETLGIRQLLLKDESTNPTGSFKARGISMAISKAKELGITDCVIPTAGNAGGALSAYAYKAGIRATVVMPRHTPDTLKKECLEYGANLILVDGLIDACGKKAREIATEKGAFDMSTLKEPYRLEGKKTLGFEIAEQLQWQLPDAIIYPTGGGTGLIGMWKAFAEMQEMGWISPKKLPKMIVVQTDKCNPMIQMFETGVFPESYTPEASAAYGLAVPNPFGKNLIQQVIRKSNGTAISVSEQDIEQAFQEISGREGLLLSPEGAATYSGLKKLIEKDYIREDESVLIFNTGAWNKYK